MYFNISQLLHHSHVCHVKFRLAKPNLGLCSVLAIGTVSDE